MPRVTLQASTELWVDLPGTYRIGETDYFRRILVTNLTYNPSVTKNLFTVGDVIFFDRNEDGNRGNRAARTNIVKPYEIKMLADNDTMVDVEDKGRILCQEKEIGDENDVSSPVYGKVYSPQFDWFFDQAENQKLNIHEMIRNFYLYHWSIGKVD